jgi:hypothetical protein
MNKKERLHTDEKLIQMLDPQARKIFEVCNLTLERSGSPD